MITTSYLDRLLDPVTQAFTPEVAQQIANLQADPELEAEINELRRKANEGSLSADEEAAYKEIVEAIDIVGILQAKARKFLTKRPA